MICSIIIPCYNVSCFLPRLFDSIRKQTKEDIEYIFVDDGSTDKTTEMLDEFYSKNQAVKVIHQQNSGVCRARNAGLKAANGDYVFFLDGDDYLTDNASAIICEVMSSGSDVVCFKNDVLVINDNRSQQTQPTKTDIPEGIYDLKTYLRFDEIVASGGTFRLYRRKMLSDHNILFDEDLPLGEVMTFFIHCLAYCKTIQMCDSPVMVYLVRQNSISRSVNYEKDYRIFDALDRMQQYCDLYDLSFKNSKTIKRVISNFILGFTINKYVKNNLAYSREIARCFDIIKGNEYYKKCLRSVVIDKKARNKTRIVSLIVMSFPAKMAYMIMTKMKSYN